MTRNKVVFRFIKTAVTYFIGNISTKLITFFLIPLYTAYLKPQDYGKYDLIISILNLIVPVVFMQIWDGIFRFSFDKDSKEYRAFIINNGFIITFIGSIVLILIGIILNNIYPEYINKWVIIYSICYAFQYYYTVIARINLNNILFSVSGVVNTLITVFLNIYMIKYSKLGIDSLYISASVGIIFQNLMIEIKFRSLSNFNIYKIDKKYILDMISFSFPLCISTIAYWLLNGYSKILISNQLGVYENGLYAIANKFTSMILIVVSVIQFSWNEMVYILSNNNDKIKIYQRGIRFIFTTTMLSGAIFIFIARLIFPFLVDESYHIAMNLIPVSMLGVAMNSFASFLGTLFLANKKSIDLLITTIYAVIVNIIISIFLLKKYKLQGILISLTIALTILVITRLITLYKQYRIYLNISNYISLFLLLGAILFYFKFKNGDYIAIAILLAFYILFIVKELKQIYKAISVGREK